MLLTVVNAGPLLSRALGARRWLAWWMFVIRPVFIGREAERREMEQVEPTPDEEHDLTLRADVLAGLLRRLRKRGFDVGVQYGGSPACPPWEPWLIVPEVATITCHLDGGPLFTIGPRPYVSAENPAEVVRILRQRLSR